MGFGPAAVQLNLDLWKSGLYKNIKSVIDLGSQELHLPVAEFEEMLQTYGVPDYDRNNFPNMANWPGVPRCPVHPFYSLLGVEKYNCIDLNESHGALPVDLNHPLDKTTFSAQFDMVTDHGTMEHVFNAPEAFRTMHSLCKQGGYIQVLQILYPFDISHGFYRFDPFFFKAVAEVNKYNITYSSYVVCTLSASNPGSMNQFHVPLKQDLLKVIDLSKVDELCVCYVFQKQSDADFCMPLQLM